MRRSTIVASFLLLALPACAVIDPFVHRGVYADLEIHNRTLDTLLYEDGDGRVVEVPSCESVLVEDFRIDSVMVRAAGGFVRSFGTAEFAVKDLHLVEVASAMDSGPLQPGPAPRLPPCDGHAEAQAGT